MKIASSTKLGSNTMHRRIRWRTWLSLTKGVSKNGMKFGRTNCNFFHLGTNRRIFFFAVRWETVNSRAQNDCIVYNLKDAAMAKWTVIPECITILLQSQIISSRFWIENAITCAMMKCWQTFKMLVHFQLLWTYFFSSSIMLPQWIKGHWGVSYFPVLALFELWRQFLWVSVKHSIPCGIPGQDDQSSYIMHLPDLMVLQAGAFNVHWH